MIVLLEGVTIKGQILVLYGCSILLCHIQRIVILRGQLGLERVHILSLVEILWAYLSVVCLLEVLRSIKNLVSPLKKSI